MFPFLPAKSGGWNESQFLNVFVLGVSYWNADSRQESCTRLQGVALVGDSPFLLDGAGEASLGDAPAIIHFERFDQGLGFVGFFVTPSE